GHTQVVPDGLPCACGQHGCVEAYASGRGFMRRLEAALASGTATRLAEETGRDASRVTAALVARAAGLGDAFAKQLWDDAERYLGQAIANYVTLLNPELLVLGGGVMTTVPSLAPALEQRVRSHAAGPLPGRVRAPGGRDWATPQGSSAPRTGCGRRRERPHASDRRRAIALRPARRSLDDGRARRAHSRLPLAVSRAHALQLGRRAVRPRPARVRRGEAPASPARLSPLRSSG